MREHSDIMHAEGKRMSYVSVPGCMDLSTVLSLNIRSAMCIPPSYNSATVSSHFSLAAWMHNEAYRIHRSMNCKCSHCIFYVWRTLRNSLGVPIFSSCAWSSLLEALWPWTCQLGRAAVPPQPPECVGVCKILAWDGVCRILVRLHRILDGVHRILECNY